MMQIHVSLDLTGENRVSMKIPNDCTVEQLKKSFRPSVSSNRKDFRVPGTRPVSMENSKRLFDYGIVDGDIIQYKDLGPQVGYRSVFVAEYAGPLLIILFYAIRPSFLYDLKASSTPFSRGQKIFITLFALHFIKRELETFFVHKFSRPTMPIRNIFKNCIYYWCFALFIGYVLCHPMYTSTSSKTQNIAATGMIIFELLNFCVHYSLSRMRKKHGDKTRRPPQGILFSLVSCPNYLFEVLSWVCFSFGTNIFVSWLFTAVGLWQMTQWALAKHQHYITLLPKIANRKSIIPLII